MEPDRLAPPHLAEFEDWTKPAGGRNLRIQMGGMTLDMDGLSADLADAMALAYGAYLIPGPATDDVVRISARMTPVEYFIPPRFREQWENYRFLTAFEDDTLRTMSYRMASWIDLGRKVGMVAIARGNLDPAPRAMENFLRSTIAWLALRNRGLLVHGASIVRGSEAYIFYGPSGAGKSTLAASNCEGTVISDDLTLVVHREEQLLAAGTPFRGTYKEGSPVVGTFPVAGFYRIWKDSRTEVRIDDGMCFPAFLGNLPFVIDHSTQHPWIIDFARDLVKSITFRHLHFTGNEEFWQAIDHDRLSALPPQVRKDSFAGMF